MENKFEIIDTVLYGCSSKDEHIKVPEGVTEITFEAFECNHTVKIIEVPSTLKVLDPWTIYECDSLENIIINENNPYMVKINERIYSRDKSVLLLYPQYLNATVFEIPPFVTEIGRCAFYNCCLQKIICNEGLEKIGDEAFSGCFNLNEILIPDTVKEIGRDAFLNCSRLRSIKLPGGISVKR